MTQPRSVVHQLIDARIQETHELVLAEHHDVVVLLHGSRERQVDGFDQGELRHRGLAPTLGAGPHKRPAVPHKGGRTWSAARAGRSRDNAPPQPPRAPGTRRRAAPPPPWPTPCGRPDTSAIARSAPPSSAPELPRGADSVRRRRPWYGRRADR